MNYKTNDPELAPNVPHADRGFDRRRDDADRSEMDRGPSDAASLAAANLVAMAELAKRAQTYPETATSRVDAGAIAANTIYILAAKLFNVPIRSAFFENGTTAPISVFRGSTGAGAPIITVGPGSYATFNVGSDITEISAPIPRTAGGSAIAMLSVTDRVWAPSRNLISEGSTTTNAEFIKVVGASGITQDALAINGDTVPTATNGAAVVAFDYVYNGTAWDRAHSLAGSSGVTQSTNAGRTNVNVAAAAVAGVTHAGAGRFASLLVVTAGTAALTFTDGPAGVTLAIVKATAVAGDKIIVDMAFVVSLYCNSGAGSPQVTVSYD